MYTFLLSVLHDSMLCIIDRVLSSGGGGGKLLPHNFQLPDFQLPLTVINIVSYLSV